MKVAAVSLPFKKGDSVLLVTKDIVVSLQL